MISEREYYYPRRQGRLVRGSAERKRLQVILKEDLFAAVDTLTDPSTGYAYVLTRKPNGDLRITTRTILVVNRFENISVDDGTYAKAEWIDGEWQLYAADCQPGDSSSNASEASDAGSHIPESIPPEE